MNPAEQPTHKKWSNNEDEHLLLMNRRASSLKDMAARFGVPPEEIQVRLDMLAAARDAERDREAQKQAAKAEAAPVVKMDAFTMLGTKLCRGYEIMGQDLEKFINLCSPVDEAELTAIVAAYLKGAGVAAEVSIKPEHFAAKLQQHFIIIPRVMLQVAPAQPTTQDAPTEQHPTETNGAGDQGGNRSA
jgi:hypothetical protein